MGWFRDWGRVAEVERLLARLTGEVSMLEKHCAALTERVERGSTVAIRADLDGLIARVESLATSNRREFGKLHAGQRKTEPEGLSGPDGDDLAETIRLQRDWSGDH